MKHDLPLPSATGKESPHCEDDFGKTRRFKQRGGNGSRSAHCAAIFRVRVHRSLGRWFCGQLRLSANDDALPRSQPSSCTSRQTNSQTFPFLRSASLRLPFW
jgi:hypothetical protein